MLTADFTLWIRAVLDEREYEKALRKSSRRSYVSTYQRWIAFCFEDALIDSPKELTSENIDRFLSGQTCGAQTKRFMLYHMLRLLSWASRLDDAYAIEIYRLKRRLNEELRAHPSRVKRKTKVELRVEQMRQLLIAWDDNLNYVGVRNSVLMHLCLYTGLRRRELVALMWTDWYESRKVLVIGGDEGRKTREVMIFDPSSRTSNLMNSLRRLQSWGSVEFMFTSFRSMQPVHPNTVNNIIAETVHRVRGSGIEVPDITSRDLRRAYALLYKRSGGDILDISVQLGVEVDAAMRYCDNLGQVAI